MDLRYFSGSYFQRSRWFFVREVLREEKYSVRRLLCLCLPCARTAVESSGEKASLIMLMLSLDMLWEVTGSGGGLTNMKIVGAS